MFPVLKPKILTGIPHGYAMLPKWAMHQGPRECARTGGSCECSLGAERPDLRESFAFDWHLGDDRKNDGIFVREILDEKSVIILG